MTQTTQTDRIDYTDLPDRVVDAAAPPEEWVERDPTRIRTDTCLVCGDTMYWVELDDDHAESCPFCGVPFPPVTDWGEPTHAESVYDGGAYEPVGDDDGVMCGGCYETFDTYANTLTIVVGTESATVEYDSGVYHDRGAWAADTVSVHDLRGAWPIAEAIIGGTRTVRVDGWRSYDDGPSDAGPVVKIGTGWHGSMDRSEQSDAINALTRGEFGFVFPVAVVFTTTSNVFSVGIDVYAPEDDADTVARALAGTAGPAHAGVRFE